MNFKLSILMILVGLNIATAARVKDVASLEGVQEVPLVGYGLIVGLAGTGDGPKSAFTVQSTVNMLRNLGIQVPDAKIRTRNIAAVMITARLDPFRRKGAKFDVTIASLGDARSLEGGVLLMSPLQGPDQEIYAIAQGALATGGFSLQGKKTSSSKKKNHTLTALIPGGATVERTIPVTWAQGGKLRWLLNEPDFSSAKAMADAINAVLKQELAIVEDAGAISLNIGEGASLNTAGIGSLPALVATAENASFTLHTRAKVIMNERTGTIVAGTDVKISEVTVSHGGINLSINSEEGISQPSPLTQGKTKTVIQEQLDAKEEFESDDVKVMPRIESAGQLAEALNGLGVSPRDIISIFQAIQKAGALEAELIVL
jgi:flagellar P-ring protein FlgI